MLPLLLPAPVPSLVQAEAPGDHSDVMEPSAALGLADPYDRRYRRWHVVTLTGDVFLVGAALSPLAELALAGPDDSSGIVTAELGVLGFGTATVGTVGEFGSLRRAGVDVAAWPLVGSAASVGVLLADAAVYGAATAGTRGPEGRSVSPAVEDITQGVAVAALSGAVGFMLVQQVVNGRARRSADVANGPVAAAGGRAP